MAVKVRLGSREARLGCLLREGQTTDQQFLTVSNSIDISRNIFSLLLRAKFPRKTTQPRNTTLETQKRGHSKRPTLPLMNSPPSLLYAVVAALRQQQGPANRTVDANALSVASAGSSTPPATVSMSQSATNSRTATLPGTAPSPLPGPASRREMGKAGEDFVLPTSPQQQQRLRITSGSTPPGRSNQRSSTDDDGDDGQTEARASCTISAVSTPRAAWAEDGDFMLDDVFGGSSNADGHGSDSADSRGFLDGAKLVPGEDGLENGPPMAPTTADAICHDDARRTDGLGGSRCLDTRVVQQPCRAAFGKPSTKVRRPPCKPSLLLTTARYFCCLFVDLIG